MCQKKKKIGKAKTFIISVVTTNYLIVHLA